MLSPACCPHCRVHAVHIVSSTLSPASCPHCGQHPAHTVTGTLPTTSCVLPSLGHCSQRRACCLGCDHHTTGAQVRRCSSSRQGPAHGAGARRGLFLSCRDQLCDSQNQLVTDPPHILPHRGQWDSATPPPSSHPPRSIPSASPPTAASPARPKSPAGRLWLQRAAEPQHHLPGTGQHSPPPSGRGRAGAFSLSPALGAAREGGWHALPSSTSSTCYVSLRPESKIWGTCHRKSSLLCSIDHGLP